MLKEYVSNTSSSESDCFHYLLFKRYTIFGKCLCYKYIKNKLQNEPNCIISLNFLGGVYPQTPSNVRRYARRDIPHARYVLHYMYNESHFLELSSQPPIFKHGFMPLVEKQTQVNGR